MKQQHKQRFTASSVFFSLICLFSAATRKRKALPPIVAYRAHTS